MEHRTEDTTPADPILEIMEIVTRISGIQLTPEKRTLVETRLTRRALSLGLKSQAAYFIHFNQNRESEIHELVSTLTTHTTSFFREIRHFDFLRTEFFPLLCQRKNTPIRIWSAASSTGEEAYSLAITLAEFLSQQSIDRSAWPAIEILGTDIDPRSIEYAANGIFTEAQVEKVPPALLTKYFDRGRAELSGWYRIRDDLHALCRFRKHNLQDSLAPAGPWDLVFLRNVLIYFNKDYTGAIARRIQETLSPEGLLVIGHSDTFMGAELGLKAVGNSIYAKPGHVFLKKTSALTASRPQPIRVIIVDDSKAIRAVLKRIIQSDPEFQVVAEAEHPLAAQKWMDSNPVDLMTLDIHMPVMDGVTYLEKIRGKTHPPVVMISSISYEDAAESLKCLELGAVEYIEKPRGLDLATEKDRICSVLKAAASAKPLRPRLAPENAAKAPHQATALMRFESDDLILIGSSTGGTEALRVVLEGFPPQAPPVLIVQHIPEGFSAALAKRLDDSCDIHVVEASDGMELQHGTAYLAPGGKQMRVEAIAKGYGRLKISVTDHPAVNRHKPSVEYLFHSILPFAGHHHLAVAILTGMGADGAAACRALKMAGAHTIAQNEETCVVFGMPKVTIELDGATEIVPLPSVGYHLLKGLRKSSSKKGPKTA
ncbi:MAG: chemotaxis-specific protein-glutamate methyltransferase CheB [Bdellovibrionota bacterium]